MHAQVEPIINIYSDLLIPKPLQADIESILRTEWPLKPDDENIKPDWHITHHIVLSDNEGVLSYAAIARKNIIHESITYNIIGMSGVITKLDQRGKGYGRIVITEATNIIEKSDADLALFNTAQVGLYQKFGYEHLPTAKMLKGHPNNPEEYPEDVFALFLSEKAKNHRKDFESVPIYFGQRIW